MKYLASLFFLTSLRSFACPPTDALNSLMIGSWVGIGSKTSLISGKVTQMKNNVVTELVEDRLISENIIEEYGPEIKRYKKNYWIKAADCNLESRIFEFGGLKNLNTATFTGTFDGITLTTIQKIGEGISYELSTTFEEDGSKSLGKFIFNGEPVQIDEMTYSKN